MPGIRNPVRALNPDRADSPWAMLMSIDFTKTSSEKESFFHPLSIEYICCKEIQFVVESRLRRMKVSIF
jgi:hypothetical protein